MSKYKIPTYKLKTVRDNRGGKPVVMDVQVASMILHELIGDLPYEEVWALMVNRNSEIIGGIKIAQGGVNGAGLLVQDIFRPIITHGCSGFVLGHNHPSSDTNPSREDIAFTNSVMKAGSMLQVPLLDHIIIGYPDKYSSMYELGLM